MREHGAETLRERRRDIPVELLALCGRSSNEKERRGLCENTCLGRTWAALFPR